MEKSGLLVVLSGPSGAGKGTIGQLVKQVLPKLKDSISVTTRAPRKGEVEGVHYFFKSLEEYQQMIADGAFLETAEVYCNFYGTPKAPVLKMLSTGCDVLFDIDTRGAKQLKQSYPDCVSIFIMTPSMADLKERLLQRGSETEETLQRRLKAAEAELREYRLYDYFVVNDDKDRAAQAIVNIIQSERNKTARNMDLINKLIGENK